MKNKWVFPLFGLLALTSCGGGLSSTGSAISSSGAPQSEEASSEELPSMDDATLEGFKSALTLPEGGAIRGNVYLPQEVEGCPVTWESNKPEVLRSDADGRIAPGEVFRGEEDTPVTLKARIEKDGKYGSFSQELTVLGLPKKITLDDYCGYLLVTFTGEGTATGEQVYMSLAEEGQGFKFKSLNNNKPILTSTASEQGVRDPFICRSPEGDRYFIIGTDLKVNNRAAGGWRTTPKGYTYPTVNGKHTLILWETTDLANWGEARYIDVAPENAGMAWAPEITWDEETGEYVVFSSSCIIDDLSLPDDQKTKVKGDAVYRVTTRDFVHFSAPTLFLDNQKDGAKDPSRGRNIIDASCRKINDRYYAVAKDGDNGDSDGGIRLFQSQDILDCNAWEKVLDLDELGLPTTGQKVRKYDNTTLEGPELFPFNKCDWKNEATPEYCLMGDMYNSGAGYLPFSTSNLNDATNVEYSWRVLSSTEYDFSNGGKRHGSVLQLTEEEIAKVKAAYLPA